MMDDLLSFVPRVGVIDLVDVAIVAVLLYVVLLAIKQARTTFLFVGIAIAATLYLAATSFELSLTRYVLHLIFAASLLGLVVMFHEEIRVAAERVLSWRLRWRRRISDHDPDAARVVETLIAAVTDFARERVGALIVLPGHDPLVRFVQAGHDLDGLISESLLKSIFDPHSLGHDGAVLLAGDRVDRFACHLPLSTNSALIGKRGTRHAAALGLAERTDCLCLVVSEERGTITVARHSELEVVDDLARLSQILGGFYREINPARPRPTWRDALRKDAGLKAAAVVLAMILWFLVVHEGATEYRQFNTEPAPVGLATGLNASIDPARLRVVVAGPRRSFYFKKDEQFGIDVKLFDRGAGVYDVYLTATDVTIPEGLTFVNIAPTRSVRVTVTETVTE